MEFLRNYFRKWMERRRKRLRLKFNRFVARYSKISNDDIFDPAAFSWTRELEENWQPIRDEATVLLQGKHKIIPSLGDISPDHQRLDHKHSWRAFFLWEYGYKMPQNCVQVPITAKLVSKVSGLITVMYSVHEPGMHLSYHCGTTEGL